MKYYVIVWVISILVTDILSRLVDIQKKWVKQILPIIVCLLFFVIPWIFGMGIYKGSIFWIFALSISGGLSANGLYTYAFIQKALNWFLFFIPKKT